MPEATSAYDYVQMYLDRKKLADLGVTVGADTMDALDVEILIAVTDAFMEEESAKMKRDSKNGH